MILESPCLYVFLLEGLSLNLIFTSSPVVFRIILVELLSIRLPAWMLDHVQLYHSRRHVSMKSKTQLFQLEYKRHISAANEEEHTNFANQVDLSYEHCLLGLLID
jgi:hypothetical protein